MTNKNCLQNYLGKKISLNFVTRNKVRNEQNKNKLALTERNNLFLIPFAANGGRSLLKAYP